MTNQTAGSLAPPLPELLPVDADPRVSEAQEAQEEDSVPARPVVIGNRIRGGCWLLSYRPTGLPLVAYDGTLRVEVTPSGRTASGDLYQRPVALLPLPGLSLTPRPSVLLGPPKPAHGIPIFARDRYRYYLRVTALPEQLFLGASFSLSFELWRFTAPNTWALESTLTAKMSRIVAPAGYPSPGDYAEGDVRNAAGAVVGRLKMGWLSKYFRKCSIEVDTVAGSEQPTDSGAGQTWKSVMNGVGFQATVKLSDTNVSEASGPSWSDAEMHAAMLAHRMTINLDREWRYHILAVHNIDSTPRGIMYDAGGTDSNNVPREGIGIASHWIIDPDWGTVGGARFGTAAAPYFRTAVHELGHAMGLYHNGADFGFMCTSDVIAAGGTVGAPFPSNIQWSFHPDNLKQLRHYPDPFVRPGAVAFGDASTTTPPITPADQEVSVEGLSLQVKPLLSEVPLGAPVRVDITLRNDSGAPIRVPANLSLKGEAVRGRVIDPANVERTFSTVVRCIEDVRYELLAPNQSKEGSMTLLRGRQGALFGAAGVHAIEVDVRWDEEDAVARVSGRATVMVTPALDAVHAAAAHKVLATPDAHLVLAIGGDHLEDGIEAIQAALDSDVLRPHYAVTEAKRVGQRFGKRTPDLQTAARLLDDSTVMSASESKKLGAILGKQPKPSAKLRAAAHGAGKPAASAE